ncbi:MAG: hypothetical protein K6T81_07830 [Alicyclobacillus macrosporangiidus]|nr:hypothetical protein [Alicyclobacillus macrosporangiidus]
MPLALSPPAGSLQGRLLWCNEEKPGEQEGKTPGQPYGRRSLALLFILNGKQVETNDGEQHKKDDSVVTVGSFSRLVVGEGLGGVRLSWTHG